MLLNYKKNCRWYINVYNLWIIEFEKNNNERFIYLSSLLFSKEKFESVRVEKHPRRKNTVKGKTRKTSHVSLNEEELQILTEVNPG